MRAFFLTTLRQLALAAAAILMTGSALAHSSSNSYLTLSAPAQQLILRADINLRDLDLIFDLDENRDGRVTWGETQARSSELDAWLLAEGTHRRPHQCLGAHPRELQGVAGVSFAV